MYKCILRQIREKIRTRQYVMTLHAEEEMSDDDLTISDIERVVLTGEIIERQGDRHTGEWKYPVEICHPGNDAIGTLWHMDNSG